MPEPTSYIAASASRVLEQAERLGLGEDDLVNIVDEHVQEVINTLMMLREEATLERVIGLLTERGYTILRPGAQAATEYCVETRRTPEHPAGEGRWFPEGAPSIFRERGQAEGYLHIRACWYDNPRYWEHRITTRTVTGWTPVEPYAEEH